MVRLTALFILVLSSCSSKKKQDVFGIYSAGGGRAKIELLADSTVKAGTKIPGSRNPFNQGGTFNLRGDSLFINWESGKQTTTRIEEKKGRHSFMIGATNYKQED